jgi:hypothetical protein
MAGNTVKLSITLPRELAEKVKARSGPGEVSAYIAAALEQQVQMDNLDELIAAFEAEHGPISAEAIEEKLEILRRADQERAERATTAA